MRTQLEVDPGIGLRGLEGVRPLIDEYKWAIDLEICIFPQEGLLNNPGTDELMVAGAEERRQRWSAPRPTPTSSPHGQIDRIFAIAREFDIDIDMHLDFAPTPDDLDLALRLRAGRALQVGRARRHRPRHQALDRAARSPGQVRQAHGRRRRGAHRAALDRPLPDGPAHDAQRHARRHRGAQAAAPRRQLLALDQQRAQPVHAVRRLLAGAHGQHLRQHLPGRLARTTRASAST